LVAGGLALLAAFSSSQTWARALFIPIQGTDTDRGIITLLASVGVAVLCAWRAFFGLRDLWYFGGGLAGSALAISMPMWFLVDVLTTPKTDLFDSQVRIITASWALYLTVCVTVSVGASFLVQLWNAGSAPRLVPQADAAETSVRYRRID
jgi:hypothetical protein